MTQVIGDVDGKIAVMTDDIIVTGGTLIAGAKALKEAGSTEVYACATARTLSRQLVREDSGQRAP